MINQKPQLKIYKPKFKPTTDLTLVLLPPKVNKEVTREDIKNFYLELTNILISEN